MSRMSVFLLSVLAAALVADPTFERPSHGNGSEFDFSGLDCEQARERRAYDCRVRVDFRAGGDRDEVTLGYRVTVQRAPGGTG